MSFSLSEYTKIHVGWGFAPTPPGELTALPDPLAGLRGPLRGRREWRREGRTRGGE